MIYRLGRTWCWTRTGPPRRGTRTRLRSCTATGPRPGPS